MRCVKHVTLPYFPPSSSRELPWLGSWMLHYIWESGESTFRGSKFKGKIMDKSNLFAWSSFLEGLRATQQIAGNIGLILNLSIEQSNQTWSGIYQCSQYLGLTSLKRSHLRELETFMPSRCRSKLQSPDPNHQCPPSEPFLGDCGGGASGIA